MAFLQKRNLVVFVKVQRRTLSRLGLDEEDRDGDIPLFCADEVVRTADEWEILFAYDVHELLHLLLHTISQASGGRSRGIASFARRTEASSEAGSHHSMRSWMRITPPTTILQLRPERFSSGLNTLLPTSFSR